MHCSAQSRLCLKLVNNTQWKRSEPGVLLMFLYRPALTNQATVQVVNTQWRDGKFYKGRVVDRRKRPNAKDDTDYEYYMHYINMNRRMDDWVTTDMLDFSFVMFDGVDEKSCAPPLAALMSHDSRVT